ncbi:phage head closure protein [Caballeronia sp. GAFFF2]|uniref:phage head closure protein n=1 Tax=Caballeronia sp. GAFFF2 TaxID=2921741 RepID=UPI00202952D1|nr:phage head closure protein [Caballeronia sp. GAFFF2]
MTVRAGDLNRRVRIERNGGGFDDLGQPIEGWMEVATVWGNVRMLTGKETLTSDADVGTASASIRIRYRTDITNGMRAIVDGVIFNILQPLPNIAARDYTDLACSTGSNDG